jgi:DNA polymerase-3 subunit epsilon
MKLNLKKPIAFFDLETTGINIGTDRIVEIFILKVHPNGKEESFKSLVNPGFPIPAQAAEIHGISDEDVKDAPQFHQIAKEIKNFIEGCDLAGFNSERFDIPLLAEEMLRAEVDFSMKNRRSVDVQTIFHKKEARNLEAGYRFYCNKKLENAHSAEADVRATYEILQAQVERYDDLENDIQALSEFSSHRKRADFAGFILYDEDGDEIFSFGKYKGRKVAEVLQVNQGYYSWLINADFPLYTKKVLTEIKIRESL